MAKIIFNYKGEETIININKDTKINKIFKEFSLKKIIDINKIHFLYYENEIDINSEISFNELINENDREKEEIYINVKENELKIITCPLCGDKCIKENDKLTSSLLKCKNNHNIITEMNKLRINLDNFKNDIENILKIYNDVIDNLEKFYLNNYNLIYDKNFKEKYNEIYNENIISYTKEIIKDKLIKLDKMINIYYKLNSYITIKYLINENSNTINIFGTDFVKENKQNCEIILDGNKSELIDKLKINNSYKNKNILEIKLTGVNNITSMNQCLVAVLPYYL